MLTVNTIQLKKTSMKEDPSKPFLMLVLPTQLLETEFSEPSKEPLTEVSMFLTTLKNSPDFSKTLTLLLMMLKFTETEFSDVT